MTEKPSIDLSSVRDDEILGDFARRFKDLLGSGRALSTGFKSAAEALSEASANGVIQFTLRDGRKRELWCLALTPGGCEASEGRAEHADLEIITDTETWSAIARGEMSPLEAYVGGTVRIRGSIPLARAMVRQIH